MAHTPMPNDSPLVSAVKALMVKCEQDENSHGWDRQPFLLTLHRQPNDDYVTIRTPFPPMYTPLPIMLNDCARAVEANPGLAHPAGPVDAIILCCEAWEVLVPTDDEPAKRRLRADARNRRLNERPDRIEARCLFGQTRDEPCIVYHRQRGGKPVFVQDVVANAGDGMIPRELARLLNAL